MIWQIGVVVAVVLMCGFWTDWFDRDDPSGSGDWEKLAHLRMENPGKICPRPVDIESPSYGFVCKNYLQPDKRCHDYRVRFSCYPPTVAKENTRLFVAVCWTKWFDRDNASGNGDFELLYYLRKENPGQICKTPCYIEAVTRDTHTPALNTGQVFRR
ncbi:cartilage intermediate layer protein 1 [Synchiropus splendidus]|uniref:cartilage intermediate layer protein 1 n=1 Tax=Synchiropus splendidus TaxID=270530 RepID=UPI00237DD812|nr:cartilage intermediate layer protein 1 [Synchiropus splendidus]